MRCNLLSALTATAAALVLAAQANATVLYDGATHASPSTTGFLTTYVLPPATITSSGGQTTLNTLLAEPLAGGISNFTTGFTPVSGSFPSLDRTPGFRLTFSAKVTQEFHSTVNDGSERAGFSVIALGSDKKGIELGFWNGSVAAFDLNGANTGVIRNAGESASLTTSSYRTYDLVVSGNSYSLTVDGAPVPALSGAVRDYTAYVNVIDDPYETANLVFLGDRSINARTEASVNYVALAVPEPTSLAVLALAGAGLLARRRRLA